LEVQDRQFEVVERQLEVTERCSGPFLLNLTIGAGAGLFYRADAIHVTQQTASVQKH